MTQVSVVIPTRDRDALLRRGVRAALAQVDVDVEVLVVDDGSAEPVQPFGDSRVRTIRHASSQGVARARNRGVAEARSDWVAFLDDDDLWAPVHLRRLLDAASPRATFVFARHYVIDERGLVSAPGPDPPPEGMLEQLVAGNRVTTPSAVLARRAEVLGVGGFDPELSILADWDLWLRLAEAGPVGVSRSLTVGYTQHRGSMHVAGRALLAEHRRLASKHEAMLKTMGRGLGDQLFFQWVAVSVDARRQRRLGARWYVAHQRRYMGWPAIARGLSRLVRTPHLLPGHERRAMDPQPAEAAWLTAAL